MAMERSETATVTPEEAFSAVSMSGSQRPFSRRAYLCYEEIVLYAMFCVLERLTADQSRIILDTSRLDTSRFAISLS